MYLITLTVDRLPPSTLADPCAARISNSAEFTAEPLSVELPSCTPSSMGKL